AATAFAAVTQAAAAAAAALYVGFGDLHGQVDHAVFRKVHAETGHQRHLVQFLPVPAAGQKRKANSQAYKAHFAFPDGHPLVSSSPGCGTFAGGGRFALDRTTFLPTSQSGRVFRSQRGMRTNRSFAYAGRVGAMPDRYGTPKDFREARCTCMAIKA